MYLRFLLGLLFNVLLLNFANANGEFTTRFVDGRWNGGIETNPDNEGQEECWAGTTFNDGTAFKLTKGSDENWHLRLSNASWRLPNSHRYTMAAQVDFYPQLRIAVEAKSQTRLEIVNLDQISLLGHIENGHTIDLASESFNVKYDLEGSAKAIERVRNCFVH